MVRFFIVGGWARGVLVGVLKQVKRVDRLVLRLFFWFNRWHLSSSSERKYVQDLNLFINALSRRNRFVEIGCGLGDIIRNVRFSQKFGFDSDKRVIRACRFLGFFKNLGGRLFLHKGKFPHLIIPEKIDVIVMVNWIHHIDPESLKSEIKKYFDGHLNPGGHIILDCIADSAYEYNQYLLSSFDSFLLSKNLGFNICK